MEERKIREQSVQEIILDEVLIPALQYLYEFDYENIKFDVSERNICARLALHMENIMRRYDARKEKPFFAKYYADVEYNRMGNGEIKRYENSKHLPKDMVSDLLIQSRGEAPNYLAVEMKKKKNLKNRDEDRVRLKSLVSPKPVRKELKCVYGTLLGAFIIYSPEDVVIELFENVKGRGKPVGKISMVYDEEKRRLLKEALPLAKR
ncbi:hypothetical protein [Xylanibacter ruminicola]|uniref:Conserved domain protein n=1 Tax=Xylanibacter ruminicola (strain ATCC 19189 / DSM 19721 / CIP 105475 / JCM 8958 / 23) TaxID=264731 RepID=D5ETT9_XYLR2|nr:hypothetical protein [Xylanibacter ruminicola]ADE81455.1 conserved domain protein [Xylanibacter ruminicola 23]